MHLRCLISLIMLFLAMNLFYAVCVPFVSNDGDCYVFNGTLFFVVAGGDQSKTPSTMFTSPSPVSPPPPPLEEPQ